MRTIKILPGMFGFNVELTFSSAASGNSSEFGLKPMLVAVWGKLTAIFERMEQRRQLQELPKELLKDIGLTREDVAKEMKKSLWDTPIGFKCN